MAGYRFTRDAEELLRPRIVVDDDVPAIGRCAPVAALVGDGDHFAGRHTEIGRAKGRRQVDALVPGQKPGGDLFVELGVGQTRNLNSAAAPSVSPAPVGSGVTTTVASADGASVERNWLLA